MSVLIKGAEMPKKGCCDCIFVNRKWHGDVCPFLKREVTGNVERGGFQTDCPLIPVPPHGDLIDRDALIRDWPTGFVKTADVINNAPTIIEAESVLPVGRTGE